MLQTVASWLLLFAAIPAAAATGPAPSLPTPHYHPDPTDPHWLTYAAQLHGHLGPWAAAGTRAGMAARQAAKAGGYFDIEVTVEGPFAKPPKACFLDGIQVATGATLGKRNLHWVKADQIVVRLRNTTTGLTVEVRPTGELLKRLSSFKPEPLAQHPGTAAEHSRQQRTLERIARQIARLPQQTLVTVHRSTKKE